MKIKERMRRMKIRANKRIKRERVMRYMGRIRWKMRMKSRGRRMKGRERRVWTKRMGRRRCG
jgi:hypothetical protein